MCNANAMLKWMLSNKDVPKIMEERMITLSSDFDRPDNLNIREKCLYKRSFGVIMTHSFCI